VPTHSGACVPPSHRPMGSRSPAPMPTARRT